MSEPGPWPRDMVERLALRKIEDAGHPFMHFRDDLGGIRTVPLTRHQPTVVVGRGQAADVVLAWDERVSRVHARLGSVGGDWTIEDDGLSRNGTFVNGERVHGVRRLHDRDVIQVGHTALVFREPQRAIEAGTVAASHLVVGIELSPTQRRVLTALCRSTLVANRIEAPATNEAIAREVFLSIDAVKGHLRVLFRKFGIEELPQNQKRSRLVRLALDSSLVSLDGAPRA